MHQYGHEKMKCGNAFGRFSVGKAGQYWSVQWHARFVRVSYSFSPIAGSLRLDFSQLHCNSQRIMMDASVVEFVYDICK